MFEQGDVRDILVGDEDLEAVPVGVGGRTAKPTSPTDRRGCVHIGHPSDDRHRTAQRPDLLGAPW
jgi:hypothetical protein